MIAISLVENEQESTTISAKYSPGRSMDSTSPRVPVFQVIAAEGISKESTSAASSQMVVSAPRSRSRVLSSRPQGSHSTETDFNRI